MGVCRNNVPCTGTVGAKALGREGGWHVGGAARSPLQLELCGQWEVGRVQGKLEREQGQGQGSY